MVKNNAGIEAIRKLREKRSSKATEEVKEEVENKEASSYLLHDDSMYRVNLLNHLFEISQSLKEITELLRGEEKE